MLAMPGIANTLQASGFYTLFPFLSLKQNSPNFKLSTALKAATEPCTVSVCILCSVVPSVFQSVICCICYICTDIVASVPVAALKPCTTTSGRTKTISCFKDLMRR